MKTNKHFNILWVLSIAFLWLPQAHADVTVYQYGFELGIGDWSPENGVWEVGVPTGANEPPEIPGGFFLLGTVVNGPSQGVYPPDTDSRVTSPEIQLPALLADEEIFLTFWQWFSYADGCTCDYGQIQIRYYNESTSSWSNWMPLNDSVCGVSGVWSKRRDELTVYAGKKIQIGFYHNAYSGQGCGNASTGWYIDDVQITKKVPEFTGDFEFGWADWGAYTGVWEVGTPTAGPPNCYTGSQCAGTVLDGNYPSDTDSRLVSSSFRLPEAIGAEKIVMTFYQWFSYADACNCDYGKVQIQEYDEAGQEWLTWQDITTICGVSGNWTKSPSIDLTQYNDRIIRIGFLHTAYSGQGCGNRSTGWYIDHIRITKIPPEICWCDLNGDGICNILDWPLFIQDWGRTNCETPPGTGDPPNDCECDIRTDGACNILDWPLFIEDWGKKDWCPK